MSAIPSSLDENVVLNGQNHCTNLHVICHAQIDMSFGIDIYMLFVKQNHVLKKIACLDFLLKILQ